MKRYFSLVYVFFKNCLMKETEFRFNLLVWTTMDFVFLAMNVISVELIFGQVKAIAGWTKPEVMILALTAALFNDFLWTFFMINLMNLSDLIREGNLDFVLLKPVKPRFLVSARYYEFDHYLRMPILIYLINQYAMEAGIKVGLVSWVYYFVLFFLGLFIIYNLFFMITTTSFWFIKIYNLTNFFDDTVDIARHPVEIFRKNLRLILVYLLPTIFIAYFPTQALLGRRGIETVSLAGFAAIFFFLISQRFWHFALKHYSSASS